MTRAPTYKSSPRRKVSAVIRALENRYGRPRRARRDPLEVLVRGVLSQNTTDVNSGRAYEALMETFGSWQAIAAASTAAVQKAIRAGGLAPQKARTIKSIMNRLSRRGAYSLDYLRGRPLEEAEGDLRAIKGVGVKTARLVLLFGFGRAVFVVDTHVARVARRLGLVPERCTRQRAHLVLDALVPGPQKYSAHMNMIRHGRQLCRPRHPLCERCPVRRWCVFLPQTG